MNYRNLNSIINFGDFIDIYYKVKFNGFRILTSKIFRFSYLNRVSSKWDSYASQSDFWIIPYIRENWNLKISGDKSVEFEQYVFEKYLQGKKDLNLLSIGCGAGIHERNFAKFKIFDTIVGVDVSKGSIDRAIDEASKENLEIKYYCNDFRTINFEDTKFDVILFHSSLHHFDKIDDFLRNSVVPLLRENGILVVFEYCGPNRLSWRQSQLDVSNAILKKMPRKFKTLIDGKSIKRKIYRPGLIRMLLVDPSEAPDSESLVSSLNSNFDVIEEKQLGWNISHILLKGISHNFLGKDIEAQNLINSILEEENKFVTATKENDALFGIYKRRT
nr:class I SAM-dependent methyltransferase [uncultured Flavobacterium sp.]